MSSGAHIKGGVRPAILLIWLAGASGAVAWDGTHTETGNNIEIGKGQTVQSGHEIEFFDYGSGSYRSMDVDSVRQAGSGVEIEGTDTSGNAVTLDMDGSGE
jgi:hypothetical protein